MKQRIAVHYSRSSDRATPSLMLAREALSGEAWVTLVESFVAADHALMEALRRTLPLQQEPLTLLGRTLLTPRLVSFHGDPGCVYRYSRRSFSPSPWTPELSRLREQIRAATGDDYNAVLANYYRDGSDSMGWHSDDEPELGPRWPDEVRVASISLGAPRRFVLRARRGDEQRSYSLGGGTLLVMGGATQREFRHAVPKTRAACGPRLNLTFRMISKVT